MEKSKRLLTLVAIVAVVTISGVALAINGNLRFLSPNLDLVQDFSDIVESPRQMTYPFTLTDLPEYFNASVIIEGSGYTGQPHTVYVLINHTRPDSSVWLATGNYSLTIENGVIAENITSGSFSDLRNTEPFVSPGHSWTPAIPADTYDIVLSLNAIQWTSIVEYTLNAIAGTGGTISPSGQFIVPEGAHQEFTITADTGYVISDILIDGESLIGFQPYIQDVGLGPISSDRTIEASFAEIETVKPTVTSSSAVPDPANAGLVTVTVVFSEAMDTTTGPTVTVTGLVSSPYTVTQGSYVGDTWIGTFTLLDNNEEKTATISVTGGKDASGNTMLADATAGTFAVDTILDYTYSSTRMSLIGTDITLTGASFDGSDPNTYSAGDTVSFVLDAVWDPSGTVGVSLDSLTYDVRVNLVGGTTYTVLPGVYIVYTPVITSPGGTFQFTGSFTQPSDVEGDWEIEIRVIART